MKIPLRIPQNGNEEERNNFLSVIIANQYKDIEL